MELEVEGRLAQGDASASGLAADRVLLGRASTADRVADILRTRIAEGFFQPGARLSEENIGGALGISRNTLREAFRLLTHERLLVHQLNRGVRVRVLTVEDLADIYRVRRLIECGALRGLADPTVTSAAGRPQGAPGPALGPVESAVVAGEQAAAAGLWPECATANIHFHQAIAGLAGSSRTDELMRGVLAELRLAFHMMNDARRFHEPYLTRNREILAALAGGDPLGAERLLATYLQDSRRQLIEAYAQMVSGS
ncbi:GntR family transcriptional regulator [Peterkaempfera sp. SMS 1(5)a]|uniref:GntR family transcriptional regulator n=1 Tax=Peterkaempfera podocarpi TaxID=3232308 RepID=UPI00366D741C